MKGRKTTETAVVLKKTTVGLDYGSRGLLARLLNYEEDITWAYITPILKEDVPMCPYKYERLYWGIRMF